MAIPDNYMRFRSRLTRFLSNDSVEAENFNVAQVGANIQILGNYAVPTGFYVKPPTGYMYECHRLLILVRDTIAITSDEYVSSGALSNGVLFKITASDGDSLIQAVPIKSLHEYSAYAGIDVRALDLTTSRAWAIRWTFIKGGAPLYLNSQFDESLVVTLEDDFSSLTHHTMLIQGVIISTDPNKR